MSPTIGINIVLFAFIATIVGGMGSLTGAVLGGFTVGALTVALQALLPLSFRPYRDAFVSSHPRCSDCPTPGADACAVDPRPRGPASETTARRIPATPTPGLSATATGSVGERPGARQSFATSDAQRRRLAVAGVDGAHLLRGARYLGSSVLICSDRVVVGMVFNLAPSSVGLYTFACLSALLSFGHAAFMAIGAHTGAIFVKHFPPEN